MKAKDYIIIGGAVALFLLWKNKNKKVGTTTTGGATAGTTTGGATTTVSPRPLKMPYFQMGYNPDFKFAHFSILLIIITKSVYASDSPN